MIDKKLEDKHYKSAKNFVSIKEIQGWIKFIFDFTSRFMTYRLDMIKIIQRVIKILSKKSNEGKIKDFLVKGGTANNSILGIINTYTNETFINLPYSKLVEEAKYISQKHMKNMYYNNKFPICIIPVKEYSSIVDNVIGHTFTAFAQSVFNAQINPFQKIQSVLSSNPNEKTLVDLYSDICDKSCIGDMEGVVILINVIKSITEYRESYLDIFPYCISYYGIVVHETTHAVKSAFDIKTSKDSRDTIAINNNNFENDIDKNRLNKNGLFKSIIIKRNHFVNAYLLTNHEAEAYKEQYNFLMSTVENKNDYIKNEAKKVLMKTGRYVHGTYFE
jgi:hypothetical protein